jgi:hypothetical protein
MMDPERRNLKATSTSGGKDSKLTRIPRYVVPQKKQTAVSAEYARKPGEKRKFQGSIAYSARMKY